MTLPGWCSSDPGRGIARIELHVQPNARTTGVAGVHGQALKVRVAAPPLEHRANDMLLRFLSEELQVAGARLRIARGENSRTKIVEISQVDATLLARIARLASDRPS